jgi:sialidase-1
MQQYIVSRDDNFYECFPDIVKTPSGKLITVFRESAHHADLNGNRLVWVESLDGGKIWSEKHALTERYDATYGYNCPRISALPDGSLMIICDNLDRTKDEDEQRNCEQHLFRSYDDGKTWTGPEILSIRGIVPDKYKVLSNGRHIFGVHRRIAETGMLTQFCYYSDDEGKTWNESLIASDERYNLCEVSIVEEKEGLLIAFMRENSFKGLPCFKAISHDYGTTWEGVYETPIYCCHRPVVDKCQTGNYFMTYRFMQGGKGWLGCVYQNMFGAFFTKETALATDRRQQSVRIIPIAYDRSPKADMGYSGWVQLDDGSFYVVTYLLDDAPKAQIKGYAFDRDDVLIEQK